MTPKGVSRAEVQQGLEECAALIPATALLPSEPQHKMLSNSTSRSRKLCYKFLPKVEHELQTFISGQSQSTPSVLLFAPTGIEVHSVHAT